MYSRIVNPKTNRFVKINSFLGKKILNNYIKQLGGSSRTIPNLCMERTKTECKTNRTNKSKCNWDPDHKVCYSGKVRKLSKSLIKASRESTKQQRILENKNKKRHKKSWKTSPVTKAALGAATLGLVTPGASATYPYNSTHYLKSPI